MKLKNKLIILFLFILFLFLFNTNSFGYFNFLDEDIYSSEAFYDYVSNSGFTYKYPSYSFIYNWLMQVDLTNRNNFEYYKFDYSYSDYNRWDCYKYRIFYFFSPDGNELKCYYIYSNDPIYISYEYGESLPFFRTSSSSSLEYYFVHHHVLWSDYIGNGVAQEDMLSYYAYAGFYIANFDVKDTNNEVIISKHESYNLLPENEGGYFQLGGIIFELPAFFSNCDVLNYDFYDGKLRIYGTSAPYYCSYGQNVEFYEDEDLTIKKSLIAIWYDYGVYFGQEACGFGLNRISRINMNCMDYNLYVDCNNYGNTTDISVQLFWDDNYFWRPKRLGGDFIGGKFNNIPAGSSSSSGGNTGSVSSEEYVLYLTDSNMNKRFSFKFDIPKLREDTKFYCFLDNYNRIDYNTVSANFTIYTVTTPEEYDYTDYENYLYYDKVNNKLYLPAGCYIEKYYCTGYNGQNVSLSLIDNFVAERKDVIVEHSSIVKDLLQSVSLMSFVSDVEALTYLFPTQTLIIDTHTPYWNIRDIISNKLKVLSISLSDLFNLIGFDVSKNENDYIYESLLNHLFYSSDSLKYNVFITQDFSNDLIFGSGKIISYENIRSDNSFGSSFSNLTIYNYFRKTFIYSPDVTSIGSSHYHERYIYNGQNTSYLLPDNVDKSFLNSAFFKDNPNNISGYYIVNKALESITTNTVIDYSKPTNYVSEPYSPSYVNNFISNYGGDTIENIDNSVVDNSVVDNSVTNNNYYYFDTTSMENILSKIYWEVYLIRTRMDDFKLNVENTTNNFNYNTKNYFKRVFVPDKFKLNELSGQLEETAEEHLGIIYQPWGFVVYTLGLFSEITDYDNIVLQTPAISVTTPEGEQHLLGSKVVNFTEIFEENPTLYYMHQLYLTAVDFAILILLGKLAYRVGEEKDIK